MCGVAGIVAIEEHARGPTRDELLRMAKTLAHRGPDEQGVCCDERGGLAHTRLSLLDLSPRSNQPFWDASKRYAIVYNGEVFNHAEIRPDLERAGCRYRTRCDTETILHAYGQYGADCVSRFRGMFAFAIWDSETRTLFCARDRLGIKPLY